MIDEEYLDEVRRHCSRTNKSGKFYFEKSIFYSNLYIGDCIRELTGELKNINKNLEKIANNTEKQVTTTTGYMHVQTPLKGEFYGPVKKDLDLGPTMIINGVPECNIGKDIVLGPVHKDYGVE